MLESRKNSRAREFNFSTSKKFTYAQGEIARLVTGATTTSDGLSALSLFSLLKRAVIVS